MERLKPLDNAVFYLIAKFGDADRNQMQRDFRNPDPLARAHGGDMVMEGLVSHGWAEFRGNRIHLTENGLRKHDQLIADGVEPPA